MESKSLLRLVVVSGALSVHGLSSVVAQALASASVEACRRLDADASVCVETIALDDIADDLAPAAQGISVSDRLTRAWAQIAAADALIAAAPTYFAAPSGLFTLFFQLMPLGDERLNGLPVALAATGGTARHSLVIESHLRPLFAYMNAAAIRTGIFATTASHLPVDRIGQAAKELASALHRT